MVVEIRYPVMEVAVAKMKLDPWIVSSAFCTK